MEAEVLGAVASTEAVAAAEGFRVGPFDDPDRYEIGEPVEAGAEGVLYRGRLITPTSRLSLSVAVKALQPAYAARIDQWAARWRDQVELLRSLQIPGLVGVREGFVGPLPHRQGADTAGRNLYLVMNWVEGEALDHWVLRHRGVDVSNALKLLLPVAVAVDTMHGGQLTGSVPVVHRDIKPANILIGKGGSVLVDFGLTKGLSIGHPVGRAGTPGYIAPEVVAGGGYTPAADRYAFGATVFFLLTGRHPSTATNLADLRRFLEEAPVGGGVSPELVERVVAMLDPDPNRRPAALANWIAQLRQSSLDDEVLTVRLAPPAPARPRRGRGVAGTAGGANTAATGSEVIGSGSALSGGVGVTTGVGTGGYVTGTRTSAAPVTTGASPGGPTTTTSGDVSAGTSAGWELGEAHRRGGAHRAPRGPQHARPPRAVTRRYALAVVLAAALVLIASDAGALARPGHRTIPVAVSTIGAGNGGSTATVTPRSRTPGIASANSVIAGGFGPEASNQKGDATVASSTTVPSAAACVKSLSPSCGPVVYTPPINNKALTVSFSYQPQHPQPGQTVTFIITLDDPDDVNVQLNGVSFGESTSAGAAGLAAANSTGPSCPSPHGAWPAPAPPGHGHRELTETFTYANPGSYPVRFTASSGKSNSPCGAPDPYASTGMSATQTVVVENPPPPPTTTTTSTTLPPPPPDTTTTVVTPQTLGT